MSKIRILIVDDAVTVRRLVTQVLDEDPALQVIGTAPNGVIALAKLPQLNPDVVILDVEMPEMNGLDMLASLRKTYPRLPVIMFSRFTERGAAATLEALALGASDYVAMPEHGGSFDDALECIRTQLIPKIKLLAGAVPTSSSNAGFKAVPRTRSTDGGFRLPRRVELVAIGASTGGPNALTNVLSAFPADLPVPVLIVQHMPPMFTRLLAQRLATHLSLPVREASPGCTLLPGQVWLAPGDYHLALTRSGADVRLLLHQRPHENSCRPSVDVLFRAVADVYGQGALGVVLTGMGQDGLRGCEQIQAAGGRIIVQDEATSVVWGMPGFVARAGLAEQILPLDQLGPEIVRRVALGRSASFHG